MTIPEFFRELDYPFRSQSAAIALGMFFVFAFLISAAFSLVGLFALFSVWLAMILTVAFVRYLVLFADARARGTEVAPPGAEYFLLVGNLWTLFPAVIVLSAAFVADALAGAGYPVMAKVLLLLVALTFPASIGVLSITQSAPQSINPFAIAFFIRKVGTNYIYLLVAAIPPAVVIASRDELPLWLFLAAAIWSSAAFFSVIGGVVRSVGLMAEVSIEDAIEPTAEERAGDLDRERTQVLNHAYGFASRGNRAGALSHIREWIDREDPDPDAAEAWFFERMLTWDNSDAALVFARDWLGKLLVADDKVRAVKLMMRCQMIEERFRPLPDDLEAAIQAAEACRSEELVSVLKRV